MVLWTVQFWLDYGINNSSWRLGIDDIFSLLDRSLKLWIHILDTASVYGNAEEIIWQYIRNRWLKWKIKIISKFTGLSNNTTDIYSHIKESIWKSIHLLNVEFLDGYLLHNAKDFYNDSILEAIVTLKKEWYIKNIWVSIYDPQDALCVSINTNIDYIQIPFNIFDQRLKNTEFFNNCRSNWIKIFARSIFLQWLILMENTKIPQHLSWIIPYLDEFDKIIFNSNLTRQEAAMQYVLQNKDIDYLVFWVDNLFQLNENISIVKKNIDFSLEILEIENKFKNIDLKIISPNLW